MKLCPSCNIRKKLLDFSINRKRSDGREAYCRDCRSNKGKNRYNKATNINPYESSDKPKICSKCNKTKTEKEFYFRKESGNLRPECKACISMQVACNKYGISIDEVMKLYEKANNKCQVCGSEETPGIDHQSSKYRPLVIDHDHKTKEIRGLLCNWCNSAIGHLKDNPENCLKMFDYLKKTSSK